jgi:SAM-dependent methyltransferase
MFEDLYTSGDYLKKNPTWHIRESPWKAREIVRMMQQNNLVPNTICEVGCGAGEILRRLQTSMEDGCTLWGYEISPQAFALCKSRENEKLHFKLADIRDEKDAYFDLILIMDVLEHMEDYFSFLREIKPKSQYKIIQVPLDVSVRAVLGGKLIGYREAYGHIHYFTKEIALQMLRDVGYEVLDHFYTGERLAIPWEEVRENPLILPRKLLGKIKRQLLYLPSALLFAIHQDLAARIFGEWRLLILAK